MAHSPNFQLFLFTLFLRILDLILCPILHIEHRPHGRTDFPVISRTASTSEFEPLEDKEVEYFFASDASAIIEHTNRVIYFEVI